MYIFLKIFFIILLQDINGSLTTTIDEIKSYKNYKVYQIQNGHGLQSVIKKMQELDHTLYYTANSTTTHMLVSPELMHYFEQMTTDKNLQSEVVVEDYSESLRKMKLNATETSGLTWDGFYDVDEIYEYLKNMSRLYKNSSELIVGGTSYEGRQILGLRINTPSSQGTSKPVIFIESGIHAREFIGPAVATYFIQNLLTSTDPDIQGLRDHADWHIFPTINPDGYHYAYTVDGAWRKTRSKSPNGCYGADANRNWNYNWGRKGSTTDPCDFETYAGASPFSEVETRTISNYITGLKNLKCYITFHSSAKIVLVPYSDSTNHTENYDDLVKIGKTSIEYGYKVNHVRFSGPATAAEILYSASGSSMDWVKYALQVPLEFTYELYGTSLKWHPLMIYHEGNEITQMILGLVTEAKNLNYL